MSTIPLEIISSTLKNQVFFPLGDLGTWIEPGFPPASPPPSLPEKRERGPSYSLHRHFFLVTIMPKKKEGKKKKKKYGGGCCFALAVGRTGISQGE
jgi:hypothetical protein